MKKVLILLLMTAAVFACNGSGSMNNDEFKSERISKTVSFIIDANVETTFPLYGAFEERKWALHWKPVLIYPDTEIIEEGTTFKTEAHGHSGESEYLWIVTKYYPAEYLIQYLVSTENRFWTINVQCESIENGKKTKTIVTYTYTGLNDEGNMLNKKHMEKMYEENLKDWAEAINNYLRKR